MERIDKEGYVMNLEGIDNLKSNNKLNKKIETIEGLLNKGNCKEAYYKLAAILEYINTKFIMEKLETKLKYTDIMAIINIYQDKEKKLFDKMIDINDQYNMVSENGIDEDDVSLLALKIDSIYEYMTKNYGEFI